MSTITELHSYLENSARVKKLKEEVEKLEKDVERIDEIGDIDEVIDDLSATLYNKISLRIILLKLQINEIEKDMLEFELNSAVSD